MDRNPQTGATIENKVEARQGETSGHMRWVLLVSIVLAVAVVGGVAAFYGWH